MQKLPPLFPSSDPSLVSRDLFDDYLTELTPVNIGWEANFNLVIITNRFVYTCIHTQTHKKV
jgi:hypothetical protein